MEKKNTLHIIPHSHWDREWYLPFESHRVRLVELFDTLIELMEKNPAYTYYHMDGQFIVIEDYLEIRPHMRDRLLALVKANRIQIGPWYILQDEYLTSGEANIRNMLYGLKLCRNFGAEPVMSGYFPDAFGNISQAPQIVRGFGIDNAIFGRGLNEVGMDNTIVKKYGINKSELLWQSPDGSEVLGIMFVNWYANANEIPAEPEELKKKIHQVAIDTAWNGLTPELLGMNGCDHQPVQTNLAELIALANELQDEVVVKQSNFKDYVEAVRPYRDRFPTHKGEIAGQLTNGSCLLINTASCRMDIKQENQRAQNLLERITEPLNAYSFMYGDKYDLDYYLYAWRILMQNHPHDSICSCSHDAIYDEMMIRFAKSEQTAESLREAAIKFVAENTDTSDAADRNIVVFSAEAGCGMLEVETKVDFPQDSGVTEIHIEDMAGNTIPADITFHDNTFTYTLPDDAFRKTAQVKRFDVKMQIPSDGIIGARLFKAVPGKSVRKTSVKFADGVLENEKISIAFADNGSFTVTEKASGRSVGPCCIFEDVIDIGDTYNFKPLPNDVPLTTANAKAEFSYGEGAYSLSVTAKIKTERCEISSTVTLTEGSDKASVKTTINNTTGNHRIRALFENNIKTDVVYAEGQFDLVKRNIQTPETWTNPYNTQRAEHFIMLRENEGGFLVAHKGLNEYEIMRDGSNTMALTLLRCVAEMGDWGYFPTPKAQCIGEYTLEYCVIPFAENSRESAFSSAYTFASNAYTAVDTGKHSGNIPAENVFAKLDDNMIRISALKRAEDGDGLVLRLYNIDEHERVAEVKLSDTVKAVYASEMDERAGDAIQFNSNAVQLTIPAKKIVTYRIKTK